MADENSFLARVEAVTAQVSDLLNDKTSVESVDCFIQKQTSIAQLQAQEKAEKDEKLRLYGRPGAGSNFNQFECFCKKCFTEYSTVVSKCGRCGNSALIGREDRRAELLEKVNRLRQDQAMKQIRKDRFDKYLKTRESLKQLSGGTDFERWSLFEASESDEDAKKPILPTHDAQFVAMEKEIQERTERKRRATKKAEEFRLAGNRKFAAGNFQGAWESYKEGLESDRGNKELLGNLALVEFKLGKFADAISSATKVLDICELFEGGFETSPRLCGKAFLRRANAKRELKDFQGACDDLKAALRLDGDDTEIKKHLEICEQLVSQESESTLTRDCQSKLSQSEIPDGEISDLCNLIRSNKCAQLYFISDPLKCLLEDLQGIVVHTRKFSEIHDKTRKFLNRLQLLEALVSESDAAASLLLSHAYLFLDLTPEKAVRDLTFSILARLSTVPTGGAELRRLYLKPTMDRQRNILICEGSPDSLTLLTNILFGASESDKAIFRQSQVSDTIGNLLQSNDAFFIQKAAALACNLGEDRNVRLMAECVNRFAALATRTNLESTALDQLLNAVHNAVVLSEQARDSLAPVADVFTRVPADKRTLTILLKLGQSGADLTDSSDAVALAKSSLDATDTSCKDGAVRLLAYAFQKDSTVLDAALVHKLMMLMVAIKPTQYVKSSASVTPEGMLRGNVCLLLGHAADRQILGGLANVDLTPVLEPIILTLRMETEAVQKNAGVALTKLARLDKYKETVRELRGFESLGQIQLKLIQK